MTNPIDRVSRRIIIKAAGSSAAVGTLAAGTTAARDQSGGDAALEEQLATVTDATEGYEDPAAAIDDGFQVMGPFVPGMGWHFMNPENVQAAVENGFDVERPQLLTYGDTGAGCDGELVLGSVEYAIPVGAREYDEEHHPDLFDDDDGSEEWHVHPGAEHAFALPVDPEAGLPEDFPESPVDVSLSDQLRSTNWTEIVPGGDPGAPLFEHGTMLLTDLNGEGTINARAVVGSGAHPSLWTLHAWVHHENPDGVFAETNRDLPGSPEP